MTYHEHKAMKQAVEAYGDQGVSFVRHIWTSARKYEPPALCNNARNAFTKCELLADHNGDHRSLLSNDSYVGWPRT